MDIKRYRIVVVGAKQADLLSKITQELTQHNYEIETLSSLRLGHSIVIVCLVEAIQDKESIKNCLNKIVTRNNMKLMVDQCTREKFKFIKSDAFIRIRGPHEAGIKSYVISELVDSGLDIHGLESDTYEANGSQRFVINIKGKAITGTQNITICADKLSEQGIKVNVAKAWELLI